MLAIPVSLCVYCVCMHACEHVHVFGLVWCGVVWCGVAWLLFFYFLGVSLVFFLPFCFPSWLHTHACSGTMFLFQRCHVSRRAGVHGGTRCVFVCLWIRQLRIVWDPAACISRAIVARTTQLSTVLCPMYGTNANDDATGSGFVLIQMQCRVAFAGGPEVCLRMMGLQAPARIDWECPLGLGVGR
jgi:hypothetical protein